MTQLISLIPMFGIFYIGIFISIIFIGIIIVVLKREQYKSELGFLFIVIIYFVVEILYFTTYNLSTETYFVPFLAKVVFSISIVCRILSISVWSSSHSRELFKNSKFRFLPLIFYLFILGLILSLINEPNSFIVIISGENYIFTFNSLPLLTFLIIFHTSSLVILWLTQIIGFKNFSDKDLAQFNNYYIILFSSNTLFYMLYLVSMNEVFRILTIIFYLIAFLIIIYIIIRKPSLFLVYTNKIYDLIIFHKSGILLYSYNFQTGKEADEKSLKGSILIGISHIMANLSSIESLINHIKMKDKAIVFNFEKELGIAILLIAKHKNQILENSVNRFIKDFSQAHKNTLKNLKGLIDTSGFQDTNKYVNQHFKQYILK